MDNNDLGFNISIAMRQTTSTLRLLKSELKSSGYEIKNIQTMLDGNKGTRYIANVKKGFRETKIVVDDTFKSLKNSQGIIKYITKETNDWKNVLGKITIDTGKLYLYWNLTKKIRSTIAGWVTSAIDYNETVNKFNVSMGKSSEQATKFQNRLSEAFGIAKADMMDYQATFKNIMSGLGDISSREAEKVSESLIQMGLDYSSLFNVNQASAMNKMQAALVGSIMPIRRDSGYDVSKNAVSAKIQELGINRTYTQLNETEKRLLRIILLMEQMKRTGAFEDLARTIESPSNQIKVLKNQLQELGVWLGNVFMGTLSRVLPYINGFVMALKEVVKMLAFFVGFTQDTSGLDDILQEADGASSNIADNLGSAASSAKDIKKYLMGFDVLNVIQTPKETGSGAGALDTIDPKILQALKDYDSIMSNVKMKATDIRDRIMEWLGFTKEINPETGEITWKLKDGYTNLEKIKDIAILIGSAILGWKLAGFISSIGSLISKFKLLKTDIDDSDKSLKSFKEKLKTLRVAAGLTISIASIYFIYEGVKGIRDGEITGEDLLKSLGGAIGLGVGVGLLTGSVTIGLIVVIASIAFVLDEIAKQTSTYKLYDTIKQNLRMLGLVSKFDNDTLEIMVKELAISIEVINFLGLGKHILKVLKNELLSIAKKVENIPIIGKSLALAIRTGIKASEAVNTEQLKTSTVNSINNASPFINDAALKNGKEIRQSQTEGYVSEEEETSNIFSSSTIKSLKDASINARKEAIQQGKEQGRSVNEGIASESLESGTNTLLNTSRITLKNSSLFNEGKEVSKTASEGFADNDLYKETNDIINTSRNRLNNSSLFNEGEKLSLTINDGYETNNLDDNTNNKINNIKNIFNRTNLRTEGRNLSKTINDGYSEELSNLSSNTDSNIRNALNKIDSLSPSAFTIGQKLGNKLREGVNNNKIDLSNIITVDTYSLERKVTNWGQKVAKWFGDGVGNLTIRQEQFTQSGGAIFNVSQLPRRALGGPVETGQMFIAREAGPELVGQIGNTTAVMNNEQIVQAVSRGVASAVASVMGNNQGGASYKLYIDSQELTGVIQERMERNAMITGTN